jgi:branched-chain amino acid aminotransferase
MLDPHGFVSSCNATNFFFVSQGVVMTSKGDYCFNGVTRSNVIQLCQQRDVPLKLGDFTAEQARSADEAFGTGTFGGITPVGEIDGRRLPAGPPGPVTQRVRELYEVLKDADAEAAAAHARDPR